MDIDNIPWGEIGYITYKRTYSRRLNDNDPNSKTEEFPDTVEREIRGIRKQLKLDMSHKEENFYRKMRLSLKGSVAGRFMWQLGTKTVDKLGLFSLQNCALCVVDDPINPFTWAMDALMLGSGVGYNIQKGHVYSLPKLKKKIKIKRQDDTSADFIVPDTREGWVKLLGKTLKAHFYAGEGFTYSTHCIRSKGANIKGFGGIASGPEELCWGISEIHNILNARSNKKLRPIDCLDIMNIIGTVVVAGNIRRSAQIAMGDCDDIEFLRAKRWDLGNIPNWRNMSNNSVVCDDINDLLPEFWQTYEQGEPYGLINLRLARKIGRIGEVQYPDYEVQGFNPCAEQGLANYETCCLSEIYLCAIDSYDEFIKILKLLYKINKHSLAIPCHQKKTEEIVHKNMRMGIGITGYLMADEQQKSWLSKGYEELRKFDKEYSKLMNWPISIKLTTCKPSGTQSLLRGVTPGAHRNPAGPYYIRRIRIAANSPLIEVCRKHGYDIEYQRNFDGSEDKTTMVVSFPCYVPEGTPIAGDCDVIEQLEIVKRLQTEWSDNAVSVTNYYKKQDLPTIKQYLKDNYRDNFKSLSFLLYHGHGFDQAPYETISKEEYEEMKSRVIPISSVDINEDDLKDNFECEGDHCPIK